jgi:hypothetical protein
MIQARVLFAVVDELLQPLSSNAAEAETATTANNEDFFILCLSICR